MRAIWTALFGLAFVAQLTACANSSLKRLEVIEQSRIQEVVDEIKIQISAYTSYQNSPSGFASVLKNSRTKVCGNGMVGFDVVSVKLDLLSTTDVAASGGISTGVGPVGISGNLGQNTTDVQQLILSYDVTPSSKKQDYDPRALEDAPLAKAMINLWNASLSSGDVPSDVCLRMREKVTDGGNSYKMGITITRSAGGKISVGLSGATLSAGGEIKSVTGNTVTVRFEPHDFRKPEAPRPLPCKPRDPRPECQQHFTPM